MSAAGKLPAARTLVGVAIAAATIGAAAGAAGGYTLAKRGTDPVREVMASEPSTRDRIAFVRETPCGDGQCQSLWLGTTREDATEVASLRAGERCEAIAWSADGYRMGFLVNGYQFRVFNSEPREAVAQVNLVEPGGIPATRIARGITFSPNGAAVTFDDCPRFTSGCRSGLAGIR